jgi:tRNA-splicing ligase RtcB
VADLLQQVDAYCWRIPRSARSDMRVDAEIFVNERLLEGLRHDLAVEQCMNVATLPGIVRAAIAMPDIHQGYGFPIGGVAAMDPATGVVSPGGVGFDINCGVRLLRSRLTEAQIRPKLSDLVMRLATDIPSGAGRKGPLVLDSPDLEAVLATGLGWALAHGYADADDRSHCESAGVLAGADPSLVSPEAKARGHAQLGTLGAGNHFVEIQAVETVFDPITAAAFGLAVGQVVVMIHSGSRGLGHQVASDYIRAMGPVMRREGIVLVDRQLACAPIRSPEGQAYLAAMAAACNFAWTNRQVLAHRTRAAFAAVIGDDWLPTVYDVAHNIAKWEHHEVAGQSERLLVHRKGATRAFPPGHPDVPAAYRDTGQPVLIPGDMGRASYVLAGRPGAMARTFGSVCHGAGRVLSRTAARDRQNFYEIEAALAAKGIVARASSRSGITEEAPDVYKDVNEVVAVVEGAGLATRVARLRPLGVIKG